MNLHRSGKLPQWEEVDPSQWNQWQKRAAETNGIDTPANRETLKGLVASLAGIWAISKDKPLIGTALIGLGRWQDIKDGRAAEATGTKSPLGEMLDASVDKVIMAAAIPVFRRKGLFSPAETAAITAESVVSSAASLTAKFVTKREIHPSFIGKVSAFISWTGIGAIGLAHGMETHGVAPEASQRIAQLGHGLLDVGIAGGAVASIGYVNDAIRGQQIETELSQMQNYAAYNEATDLNPVGRPR